MNTQTGRTKKVKLGSTRKAVLVYQAGIANVFAIDCFNIDPFGRNAKRLLQHAFLPCAYYARGLAAAGVVVRTLFCNYAGDITDVRWSEDIEDSPFRDSPDHILVNEN